MTADLRTHRQLNIGLGEVLDIKVTLGERYQCPQKPNFDHGESTFSIQILSVAGNLFEFTVNRGTVVATLKEMVQDKEGIPPDRQTLICFGKQLPDHASLGHVSNANKVH
jgi:hypothetical protein